MLHRTVRSSGKLTKFGQLVVAAIDSRDPVLNIILFFLRQIESLSK